MTVRFNLTEGDYLAFTERYLCDSKSHQALRTRVRWFFPCIFVAMVCFYTWRDGPSFIAPLIFGTPAILWCVFYPRWFDARIRARVKKRMIESSCSKCLGSYEVQLLDKHLHSTGPLGSSTFNWSSVDRVTLDADYLFIFLSGLIGYPIRITEIGQDVAQRAHDFIQEHIRLLPK